MHSNSSSSANRQKARVQHSTTGRYAFTIVEVVVAISLSTILLIGTGALFIPILRDTIANTKETNTHSAVDIAFNDIKRDVTHAHGFLKKRLAITPDRDTVSPAPAWISGSSSSKRALMLAMPLTTQSLQNTSRELIYLPASDCATARKVAYGTVIYFVDTNSSLIRRTLTPNITNACWGRTAFQKASCSGGAGTATGCAQKDITIAQNVRNFDVTYYSDLNVTTPIEATSVYANTDNDILQTAVSAKITIELSYGANLDETVKKTSIGAPIQIRSAVYE